MVHFGIQLFVWNDRVKEKENMKRNTIGYYDYTVVLTYGGMLCAFFGILQVLSRHYWAAVLLLLAAGVCDMFDGAVASTKARTDAEKKFGIQIDSLSDLISFGVFPGVFVYVISGKNLFAGMISGLFVLCALIRLAYFNVLEEERQKTTLEKRKSYLGVPVTTIAVFLPAVYLLYDRRICENPACFPLLLLMMGIGYLLPVEIKKPGLSGKVGLIVLGAFEAIGMLFFAGWGAL